ncbi:hypothetical protein [Blastococcus sp. SYSU D00820]
MSHRSSAVARTERHPDRAGSRPVGMLGIGRGGMRVVRGWLAEIPAGTPVGWAAAQRADEVALAELERWVARTGGDDCDLMLAGPAEDVAAARETALRLGVPEAAVRVAVVPDDGGAGPA